MRETTNSHRRLTIWRTQPMYSFKEAAQLAHVSPGTVKNWLFGRITPKGQFVEPLIPAKDSSPRCSFLQLVEIAVAAKFRKAEHVSFQRVKAAYENAKTLYGLEYPFAHLKLKGIGGHIVHMIHEPGLPSSLQAVDQPEQWTLPGLVQDVVDNQFYYDETDDLAARWHPLGKDIPIVIDPQISAGLPVILDRGITVEVVSKRWKARQSIEFIAKDFELQTNIIEEAVRYAEKVAA